MLPCAFVTVHVGASFAAPKDKPCSIAAPSRSQPAFVPDTTTARTAPPPLFTCWACVWLCVWKEFCKGEKTGKPLAQGGVQDDAATRCAPVGIEYDVTLKSAACAQRIE